MTKQIIRTSGAPSSPLFSQAIKVGSTIYLSGIAGIDPKTNEMAGRTIQEQTRQALFKLREHSADYRPGNLENVVDVLVLLARPGDDFAGLNEEYVKFFPSILRRVPLPSLVLSFRTFWCR